MTHCSSEPAIVVNPGPLRVLGRYAWHQLYRQCRIAARETRTMRATILVYGEDRAHVSQPNSSSRRES